MNHPSPKALSRLAVSTGALALTLATCSACVGSSISSSGSTHSAAAGGATSSGTTGASTGGAAGGSGSGSTAGAGGAATGGAGGSTSGGSGGSAGSGSAGSGSPQTCTTQNLTATVTNSAGGGAAGSDYVDIVFQNIGDAPCTMYGYPGVSLGAGSPVQQVGQPAARNSQVSPLIVTLIPNAHAFAILQVADAGDYSASQCDPKQTSSLRVYPPNNNTLLYASFSTTGCAGNLVTLHVEAVQPGSGS